MARAGYRSGFCALIGRPNVGKSTLLNALTGEKIAIVSPKPQTTRGRILGVVSKTEGQIAFLDTPGVHQAKGSLNRYMVDAAFAALDDVELVLFLIEPPGLKETPDVSEGNRYILEKLKAAAKPTLLVINKIDAMEKEYLLPLIERYRSEFPFLEILPVSARKGDGLDLLFKTALKHLPEGDPLFDEEMLTDQQERQLVSEYIREALMKHCRQEVPYSAAVVVEYFDESEREPEGNQKKKKAGLQGLVRIDAAIYLERDSQKAIVIGKGGTMLKTIGTDARKTIERLLGTHVYLSLRVKVEEGWSDRPEGLRKLGYT